MIETVEHMGAKAAQIREWSTKDPVLSSVIRYVQFGWPDNVPETMTPYFSRREELSLQNGCLLWGSRVVVPPKGRTLLLNVLHAGHPGVCSMKRLARGYLWWPGLDAQIEQLVAGCESCQQNRPRQKEVPMSPWSFPSRPWERIHIDYAGPVEGRMLLVVVDAFSKWIDVHVTTTTSAAVTIEKLRQSFATHGLPAVLVSDNSSAFTGEQFTEFTSRNGIRHMLSPPRHPASNGQAEAAVKVVKAALAKDGGGPLSTRLARFLLAYRVRPHSTTGRAPCELLMNRMLSSHLDLLRPDLRRDVQEKQEGWRDYREPRTRVSPGLTVGERVYVTEVEGPTGRWCKGTIIGLEAMSGEVRLDDGRVFRRHFNHIRSDGARDTDLSCAKMPSDVTHSAPREPMGPVIVPRPVSSAAAEPPARAQPAATPAQDAGQEVATDAAPADTDTTEVEAATEEQTRDAAATEEQPRAAVELPRQANAGKRRDCVEPSPQAPLRRSSRPRAPVQRMNLYIH